MSGLTKSQVQLGDSATSTQNFSLTSAAADGTMKLARGNFGATSQDVLTVDAGGKVAFPQGPGPGNTNWSCIRVYGSGGYGSTGTRIRRFTTVGINQGVDLTYADSVTLGASITVVTAGVYSITYQDDFAGSVDICGISLNASSLTSGIQVLAAVERLAMSTTANINYTVGATITLYLSAGSVIRAQTSSGSAGGATGACQLTMTRVA